MARMSPKSRSVGRDPGKAANAGGGARSGDEYSGPQSLKGKNAPKEKGPAQFKKMSRKGGKGPF